MEKEHPQKTDIYLEETIQGGDYTEREKGKQTKRRLHKKETTRIKKKG